MFLYKKQCTFGVNVELVLLLLRWDTGEVRHRFGDMLRFKV